MSLRRRHVWPARKSERCNTHLSSKPRHFRNVQYSNLGCHAWLGAAHVYGKVLRKGRSKHQRCVAQKRRVYNDNGLSSVETGSPEVQKGRQNQQSLGLIFVWFSSFSFRDCPHTWGLAFLVQTLTMRNTSDESRCNQASATALSAVYCSTMRKLVDKSRDPTYDPKGFVPHGARSS